MSWIAKSFAVSLVLCQALLVTRTAQAEDPAAAEALFQEGRRLLADGQISAACEKLKESFALDAMSGTLLNLAACYEKDGKTATAWARFRNAANLAKSQGKAEQVAEANRRVKALEGELSFVTVTVTDPVAGLVVKRNNTEVTSASYGVEVPVDPGRVEIVASAPGHKSYRTVVEIGAHHDKQTVTIPKLVPTEKAGDTEGAEAGERDAEPAKPSDNATEKGSESTAPEPGATKPSQQPTAAPRGKGPGIVPWIVGGLGVASVATGGVFGYLAIQQDKEARDICPTRRNCSKYTLATTDLRDRQATAANITVGVGLAAIITATVWILVGRPKSADEDKASFELRPVVAQDTAGVSALGRF